MCFEGTIGISQAMKSARIIEYSRQKKKSSHYYKDVQGILRYLITVQSHEKLAEFWRYWMLCWRNWSCDMREHVWRIGVPFDMGLNEKHLFTVLSSSVYILFPENHLWDSPALSSVQICPINMSQLIWY